MELVYFLMPAAILLALVGLIAFVWAVRAGQFKDLETPARRILFDEIPSTKESKAPL